MDTTRLASVVAAQNPWPLHHRHVPAALVVQVTGRLGKLHAAYRQGLKVTEGWVGYDTHLKPARFASMGEPVYE